MERQQNVDDLKLVGAWASARDNKGRDASLIGPRVDRLELCSIRQGASAYDQRIGRWEALLISDCDLGRDCRIAAYGFRAQPDCLWTASS